MERNICDYEILCKSTHEGLVKQVKEYIEKGYQPWGPFYVNSENGYMMSDTGMLFTQAVVKYEDI